MMICDLCDFHVAHTYCCGFGNNFPQDQDWICDYCMGILSDNDDSDEDDISSEEFHPPRRSIRLNEIYVQRPN